MVVLKRRGFATTYTIWGAAGVLLPLFFLVDGNDEWIEFGQDWFSVSYTLLRISNVNLVLFIWLQASLCFLYLYSPTSRMA